MPDASTTAQPLAHAAGSRANAPDWTLVRRCPRVTDTLLLNDTKAWLKGLPYASRPALLPEAFPRIANELCQRWGDPSQLRAYLVDDLLEDRRPQREGFPPLIRAELEMLLDLATQTVLR